MHQHARPLWDKAVVHVLFGAGLRRAELVRLGLGHADHRYLRFCTNPPEYRRRLDRELVDTAPWFMLFYLQTP